MTKGPHPERHSRPDEAVAAGFGFWPRMRPVDLWAMGLRGRVAGRGRLLLSSAPLPHPGIESYLVEYTRGYGLWRVIAIGRDLPVSRSLRRVRAEFDRLERPLVRAYGRGHRIRLARGELMFGGTEPEPFRDSRGLLDRYWGALGDPMPPHVEGAVLWATANEDAPGMGFVRLSITFRYYDPRLDQRLRRRRGPLFR